MSSHAGEPGWDRVVTSLSDGVGTIFPAAALLCQRDGGPTLSVSVGEAEPGSWFDLASLTKALSTSVLCMRLVDAGRLSLDEPVLPGVPVAALLGHQSGLPAWLPLYRGPDGADDWASAPSATTRQAVVAAAASAVRGPLGARAIYSDLGFILLGDFLERRTGRRLDAQFAELAAALEVEVAFRPLDAPAAVPAERCLPTCRETPQREPLRGIVHDDNARAMLGVAGHAGLFGTLRGVGELATALLDAYHGADSRRRRALGVDAATVRRFFALPTGPAGATFGLGWDHPEPTGGALSSAGRLWPRDGVGHLGFTGCSLWLDPPSRTVVALLSNRVCVETPQAATASQAGIKALRPALHDAVLAAYGIGLRS